jgi:hypothetical protein
MKREEIKKIIKEETEAFILGEGIIDSLIMMFISPKLKRDVKKLKNSPEWKEWMQKLNTTRQEMELYNDRLEQRLKWYDELEKNPEKYGLNTKDIKAMRDVAIGGVKLNKLVLGKK